MVMKSGFFKSKSWALPARGKRPNRAWIHIQPYDFGVYVMWPVNKDQLKTEYLHITNLKDIPDGAFDISGGKFLSYSNYFCIAFASKPTPGFIAHEAYHLAEELGVLLGLEGEEAKAYMIQYITNQIYNLTKGVKCES